MLYNTTRSALIRGDEKAPERGREGVNIFMTYHRIQLLPLAVNPILVVDVRHLEKPVAKEGANTVNRAANILTLFRYYQFKSLRVKLLFFVSSVNKWTIKI